MNTINYKMCPLKKRPVLYDIQEDSIAITKEEPQDLSLKRKATDEVQNFSKRNFALNLSVNSLYDQLKTTSSVNVNSNDYICPESPVSSIQSESSHSAVAQMDNSHWSCADDLDDKQNIHLRGLTATSTGYTTNPYRSAFVTAAGCNPMTALWNTYSAVPNSTSRIFPSPASSIDSAAASPRSAYNYQITPPSSPASASEPEDLSVHCNIPLPALFHRLDEAPSSFTGSHRHSSSSSSSWSSSSSTSLSSLSSPSAVHSGAKNYRFKCEKCDKMYSTSMGLSKHQQFHCPAAECNQEKKQHSCHECGKLYTTQGALKMHVRTHTLPCKCPICGKAFSRPWLLQGHIRTHTGEKPFQCTDCHRSFADRSNLRAHQQTHFDVKKYACKDCHKSFSRMSLLNKHASSNCVITIA